jgi:hypothetical protein
VEEEEVMPYNISKAVVNRSRRYLDEMLNNPRTITWPAVSPRKLAYKVREALFAAKRHKDFAIYHLLHDNFRIREYPGYVEAEYIGPPVNALGTTIVEGVTVEEATDIRGVVGAVIKYGVTVDEIRFPNVRATDEELAIVYKWGMNEKPIWRLISHEDNGITMTRRQGLDEIFFWKPE